MIGRGSKLGAVEGCRRLLSTRLADIRKKMDRLSSLPWTYEKKRGIG